MNTTTVRTGWICGFCSTGTHARCAGAALNPGGKQKLLVCSCKEHPRVQRCLNCGNTRAEELTGWACTNPADCRDAIAARSAANPLRKELETVRRLAGEARRRALIERTTQQVAEQVRRARFGVDANGHPLDLQADCAADLAIARPRSVAKPGVGVCICTTCGETPTKGGRFAPGHDAKLKALLTTRIMAGPDADGAYDRMLELGWRRFADAARTKAKKASRCELVATG